MARMCSIDECYARDIGNTSWLSIPQSLVFIQNEDCPETPTKMLDMCWRRIKASIVWKHPGIVSPKTFCPSISW